MFKKFFNKIKKSPINFFSDLFIVAMVCLWIGDALYQSLIATIVTISSIILSFQTQATQINIDMWSGIGTNVCIPLSCGAGIWMVKNSIQHAIANSKGQKAEMDFPDTEVEITHEDIGEEVVEEEMTDE